MGLMSIVGDFDIVAAVTNIRATGGDKHGVILAQRDTVMGAYSTADSVVLGTYSAPLFP